MIKISALMSVYNTEETIEETIKSILEQTYSDFELIIINDGSTDDTVKKIKAFKDDRIKIFDLDRNYGVGYALNYGVKQCKGSYIAKVDGDDLYHRERFMRQVDFLEQNKKIDVVGSHISFFPHNKETEKSYKYKDRRRRLEKLCNTHFTTSQLTESIFNWYTIMHTSIMFRKNVFDKCVYDSSMRLSEDYHLYYNLNKQGVRFYVLPEVLVDIRVNIESTTSREINQFCEGLIYIKKEEIEELFKKKNNVYIWGASKLGVETHKRLVNMGLMSKGFIDSDITKQGTRIENLKVYNSGQILNENNKILVTSVPGREEIIKILKAHGYKQLKDYVVIG